MKKRLKNCIVFILCIFVFSGCNILKKEPERNVFEDINPLDAHEMKIVENMKKTPPKNVSPKLVFADSENAVILSHNGIIVINVPYGKIMHAVDNKKVGLNKLDGDNMTVVESYGNELLIYNTKDIKKKKAIEMDIHSLTIKSKPELKDKNYKKVNLLSDKSVIDTLSENGKNSIQAVEISPNDILALKIDDLKSTQNWEICIYDRQSLEPVRSFLIFK